MREVQLTKTYDLVVTLTVVVPDDVETDKIVEWLEDYAPAVSVDTEHHDLYAFINSNEFGARVSEQSVDSVYPLDTIIIEEQA